MDNASTLVVGGVIAGLALVVADQNRKVRMQQQSTSPFGSTTNAALPASGNPPPVPAPTGSITSWQLIPTLTAWLHSLRLRAQGLAPA